MGRKISRREFTKLLIGSGMGVGLLSACGGPATPAQAPTAAAPAQAASTAPPAQAPTAAATAKAAGKVVLNLWHHFGTGNMGQAMLTLAADFHKLQPDIEVQITNVPYADMWPKVMAAIAAGAPPDTFSKAPMFPPELVKDGHVEPIEKYMSWPDDVYPAYDTKIDGVRYGIPIQGGIQVLFYNKDLYSKVGLDPEKPPKTWDDMIAQGKQMTNEAQKQYGVLLATEPSTILPQCWTPFLYGAGGDFLTPGNKEAAFNSPAGVEALQLWVDMCQKYKIAPLFKLGGREMLDTFSTGSAGIYMEHIVNLGEVQNMKFKTGLAQIPPANKTGQFSGDFFPFMKASKNKEALAEWFKFFFDAKNVAWWAASVASLPSRKSAMQHPVFQEYLQKEPRMKPATEGVDYAKPWPSVIGIQGIMDTLAESLESAMYNRVTPKDALDQAAKKVNDLLKTNA